MDVTKKAVAAITVGERRREDLGDIAGLADSLARFGLLHPIIVDDAGTLIAGGRRLAAAQRLGWTEIDCRPYGTVTDAERREIELEENLRRKDLTPGERSRKLVELAETAAKADRETYVRTPDVSLRPEEKEARIESAPIPGPLSDSDNGPGQRRGTVGRFSDVPGSLNRVAERIGVPRATIIAAQQHVAAVETHHLPPETPQSVAIDYAKAVAEEPALVPGEPPTLEAAKAVVQVFRSRQDLEREQRRERHLEVQEKTQEAFDTAQRLFGPDPELERLGYVNRFYSLSKPAEAFFRQVDPAVYVPNFGEGEYIHAGGFILDVRRWCDRMEQELKEHTRRALRVVGERGVQ